MRWLAVPWRRRTRLQRAAFGELAQIHSQLTQSMRPSTGQGVFRLWRQADCAESSEVASRRSMMYDRVMGLPSSHRSDRHLGNPRFSSEIVEVDLDIFVQPPDSLVRIGLGNARVRGYAAGGFERRQDRSQLGHGHLVPIVFGKRSID
jgi:hypothetical protein